jgi:hypothetical protein
MRGVCIHRDNFYSCASGPQFQVETPTMINFGLVRLSSVIIKVYVSYYNLLFVLTLVILSVF